MMMMMPFNCSYRNKNEPQHQRPTNRGYLFSFVQVGKCRVLHDNLEYFNERVVRTERGASAHFHVYVSEL